MSIVLRYYTNCHSWLMEVRQLRMIFVYDNHSHSVLEGLNQSYRRRASRLSSRRSLVHPCLYLASGKCPFRQHTCRTVSIRAPGTPLNTTNGGNMSPPIVTARHIDILGVVDKQTREDAVLVCRKDKWVKTN